MTPNLALTPLESAQSQKHVTVNEALARLDAAIQLAVQSRTLTAPPPDPPDGTRHLIAAPATGAWAGSEGQIAAWDEAAQGWHFLAPRPGWRLWIAEEDLLAVFTDAGGWHPLGGTQLGINASADATNRLAIASDAVLLSHDGTDLRVKLNKAASTDTAALLFQSGFTGHAEIGLTGSDDLSLKTSPDGTAFIEALRVEAATARVTIPAPATVGGVTVAREGVLNLLPDSGRFGGDGANGTLALPSFAAPSYLSGYNGTALSGHGRFAHNNATYGGTAPALDPEIDALVSLLRPPSNRRYGPEWWAMRMVQGGGTLNGVTVGGALYALSTVSPQVPMPDAFTFGFYLRALTGEAYVRDRNAEDLTRWGVSVKGDAAAALVAPGDGWVFFCRRMTHLGNGYSNVVLDTYALPGSEMLIAMPRLVAGHVELDPLAVGPMINSRFYD